MVFGRYSDVLGALAMDAEPGVPWIRLDRCAAVSFTDRAILSLWVSFLASRWNSLSDASLTGALLVLVYSRAARSLFHTNPHAFCFRRPWPYSPFGDLPRDRPFRL